MTTPTTVPGRRTSAVAGCRETDLPELFRRWQCDRDEAARDVLIARFMPLARSLARRYDRSSEPFEDLLQVASLGLIKALDRFDIDRGHAFASFAVPTILGELKRYFRDSGWAVHVPRGPQERALKVEQARQQLTSVGGRPPTVFELAEYLELTTEDVLAALAAAQAYDALSLDAPRPSESGEAASYGEHFGEEEEGYALVEANVTIAGALRHLPARERLVLHLRFVEDLTQTEIAARIGVSQMQVSRLLRRSLEQLRILSRVEE
ncbi:MAG: polymerase sigma-B factor [Solirubrobacteraceae bacterium]|nr:polymerase sigma-B factor [Solirubrobacteraceae bacterium]MEA2302500.1 polymerase sigma-B factor [Solirubrobacteraceae bacterium]